MENQPKRQICPSCERCQANRKSTIVEEFAKNEFKSYILIDFAHTSKDIIALFDDTYELDFFFYSYSS